jgi:hypothetical protein
MQSSPESSSLIAPDENAPQTSGTNELAYQTLTIVAILLLLGSLWIF